jgi:hypothetical protein
VNILDSWKPEETDKGIACESPDKVATVFFYRVLPGNAWFERPMVSPYAIWAMS